MENIQTKLFVALYIYILIFSLHIDHNILTALINHKISLEFKPKNLFSVQSAICGTICLIYTSPPQPINSKNCKIGDKTYLMGDHLLFIVTSP